MYHPVISLYTEKCVRLPSARLASAPSGVALSTPVRRTKANVCWCKPQESVFPVSVKYTTSAGYDAATTWQPVVIVWSVWENWQNCVNHLSVSASVNKKCLTNVISCVCVFLTVLPKKKSKSLLATFVCLFTCQQIISYRCDMTQIGW